MNTRELLGRLEEVARPLYADTNDPSHDWAHITRARRLADRIALGENDRFGRSEKPNKVRVWSMVLMHDCVKVKPRHGEKDPSSDLSAARAEILLDNLEGFPKQEIPCVVRGVADHSLSKGRQPHCLESAILQDADRIDSMGAMGFMRVFAHGGAHGAKLFCPQDPFGESGRPLDPYKYALDWYPKRLKELPGVLNTETARELAGPFIKRQMAIFKIIREEIEELRKIEGFDGGMIPTRR